MNVNPLRRSVAGTLLPGFEGTSLPDWLARRLRNGLAGVCLFGSNVTSREQLRALTAEIVAANPFALIAIDEEGGDVTRLFYDSGAPYPGNAVLGRLDDIEATAATARAVGRALADAGVNLDFAPDIDINSNPDNPVIGVRSFGQSPDVVERHTRAWVRGLQSQGVAASAKHFPGHGDTATDSHRALPVVDLSLDELRSRELLPFVAAIDAGVQTIMTSHILLPQVDPDHPATLSRRILGDLLRDELGFGGVIVSDALDMAGASGTLGIPGAAVGALAAGCDLLCIGTGNTDAQLTDMEDAVLAAVAEGHLGERTLRAAATRVRRLGRELSAGSARHLAHADAGIPAAPLVRTVFEVSDVGREWMLDPRIDVVVMIASEPSAAIGVVPWGPFAVAEAAAACGAGLAVDDVWRPSNVVVASERTHQSILDVIAAGSRVLAVGRANHLHPWATALLDRLRVHHDVLIVEMGWPSADHAYADISTFGASRLVGEALIDFLAEARPVDADPIEARPVDATPIRRTAS